MTDSKETTCTPFDYSEVSRDMRASHNVAKAAQNAAKRRKKFVPLLAVTGLLTLGIGIGESSPEPIIVGGSTDVAALVVYGHSRRQAKYKGILAIASALYQNRISEAAEQVTPIWASEEITNATPELLDFGAIALESISDQLPIPWTEEPVLHSAAQPS
jgi:hypothetical protein